ncbi:hypothetical protein [Thermoplasma sp.]|uniref:hypothetical protein n=1 Tax=Thermoplasma sp. TaxID=1973142 RepID=UPI001279016C|nr:hypothetical protein [Thermoplasma sp.]KAA8921856.1 MAG: hypothetical protein F6Q11_07410 [Thermoplasma sp.]
MINLLYILASVIVLASLHMIAPDHWLPLAALSARRRMRSSMSAAIASALGLAHSLLSLALSFAIIFLGMYFLGLVHFRIIAIAIIAVVCVYMFVNTIVESKKHGRIEESALTVSVLPDPTVLPFIVAAGLYGPSGIVYASISFVFASVVALALISYAANRGLVSGLRNLNPITIDRIVILILIITAVYIYFFG